MVGTTIAISYRWTNCLVSQPLVLSTAMDSLILRESVSGASNSDGDFFIAGAFSWPSMASYLAMPLMFFRFKMLRS